jgi:release factor glutamine methyltransferase
METKQSIGQLIRDAARQLAALPQASPRIEAELLLMDATGLSREQLIAWPDRVPAQADRARFDAHLARRLAGEPIAYIRGQQAFWTLNLRVTPDTLIPRPETELLVETALTLLPSDEALTVADAGTGSGAIAAALAAERPAWTLIAIELDGATAAAAAQNLMSGGWIRASILRSDWLAAIAADSLDAVICNPPYIRDDDPHLHRGDLPSEPLGALASGSDGLEAIRRVADHAPRCLRPGGMLALEHGYDQGAEVRTILAGKGFERIDTRADLAGHPRVSLGFTRSG